MPYNEWFCCDLYNSEAKVDAKNKKRYYARTFH